MPPLLSEKFCMNPVRTCYVGSHWWQISHFGQKGTHSVLEVRSKRLWICGYVGLALYTQRKVNSLDL